MQSSWSCKQPHVREPGVPCGGDGKCRTKRGTGSMCLGKHSGLETVRKAEWHEQQMGR